MPRFVEVRGQDNEWLVLDLKAHTPRVLCRCTGFHGPLNAQYICEALEAYHGSLMGKVLGLSERSDPVSSK